MLCRSSGDCSWLDDDLRCQDYDFDFSVSRAWFGGSFNDIVGKCECREGKVWMDSRLSCEDGWSGMMIFLVVLLATVGGAILCMACLVIWRRIK